MEVCLHGVVIWDREVKESSHYFFYGSFGRVREED